MKHIRMADRLIGAGQPVLIVAEIGVNHDGSLARALQLVHEAKLAGADAVKFQVFTADRLMHRESQFASYQADRVSAESPVAMLRKYELCPLDVTALVGAIRACGMIPLATPFSLPDLQYIATLELPAVKIASPDLVNRPLLSAAAKLGVPMLISTGAATMDEVGQCVAWLREWRVPFTLLHCISSYPTPPEQANLRWISELAEHYTAPVGYSDHTTELAAGALAVAAGACVIEKHLTYDRAAPGPDHAVSADPSQFADYIQSIRHAEKLCGRSGKRVLSIERDVRTVSRQSLVLVRDIQPGEPIGEGDIVIQRPGLGIPAAQLGRLIGKRVRKTIRAGTMLQWEMLADAA